MIKITKSKYRIVVSSTVLLLCSLLFFFSSVKANHAIDQKNVLFISSYSLNFLSVPDQISGINEAFQGQDIDLHYEFMDMKQFDTAVNIQLFYQQVRYKIFHSEPYDAIIVGDDRALQFAMDYQEELFYHIPIVFLGINDFKRAEEADNKSYFTGIIEETSIEDNIDIARQFNKNAKKVVAIVDNTLTGIGDKERFYKAEQFYPDLEFSDINSSDFTFEDLEHVLEQVSNDTILIYTNMFLDKSGAYLSMDNSFEFIKEHTNVPVYRASVGGVGQGLLGGKMVSYEESGKIAANMVLNILSGTSIEEIPMIKESPNKYVFDYSIIQKYNINKNLIPKDAILVNKKISFIEQYKELVSITITVLSFFVILSILLVVNNIKRRRIELELKESYKKLEETFEELTASEEELRNQYEKIEEHANNIEMLNEKYEHLAHHDFLTNLPNRFQFMNLLDEIMGQYRPGAILLLDIDNFKEVNDTMGHLYGDELLKEFATRLERISDEHFFASRFGGDEFIILLSDLHEISQVEEYINRVNLALEDAFILENKENHLEYSMGVTRFPFDSNDANELLMFADTALYQVKQSGKNNCSFYNNAMQENLKDKTEIDTILRQAIKEDGFKLVYQPQVSVETGEIVGFEALIRLKEHKISPGKFISIAEENGLINKIGRWVTKEVIHQLSVWKNSGMILKPVAFNFSSKQIQDKNYLQFLKDLLKEYDVSTEFIEIEITESILLENSDETNVILNQLKEIGIKIALDDFGTGYSSLNYLAYIPVNKVKLDKSLIDKFLNLDNSMVISSIISLAHSLKLSIIAEGIEQLEQYNLLKSEGCDYIQGYLFSMPLAVDEVEKIYNTNLVSEIIKDYKNNSD